MVELLLPIVVALVPAIIAVIGARLYGVLHGIITYLFFGQLLMFCLVVFGANLGADLLAAVEAHSVLQTKINEFVVYLLKGFGLGSLVESETGIYVILGAFFVLFLISQIIGGKIRKNKVAKTKILRRQIRQY
jgi:hypothetical protein